MSFGKYRTNGVHDDLLLHFSLHRFKFLIFKLTSNNLFHLFHSSVEIWRFCSCWNWMRLDLEQMPNGRKLIMENALSLSPLTDPESFLFSKRFPAIRNSIYFILIKTSIENWWRFRKYNDLILKVPKIMS